MRRKTFIRLKRLGLYLLSLIAVCGIIYTYFFTSIFNIDTIVIEGIDETSTVELLPTVREELQKPLFRMIPGDKILSYRASKLRAVINEHIPYSEHIKIYPTNLHTLKISMDLKTSLFRSENGQAIATDGTLYTDTREIGNLPVLIATTTPQAAVLVPLSEFVNKVSEILWPIDQVVVDEHHDVYLYGSTYPGYVVISYDPSFDLTWSTFLSAIDTDPLKARLVTEPQNLSYIDVRYGNKVFYKFTNEGTTDIIPTQDDQVATTTIQQ